MMNNSCGILFTIVLYIACLTNSYGKKLNDIKLIYDSKNGTYTISYKGQKVINDAQSYVVLENKAILTSKKSTKPIQSSESLFDDFLGSGKKISYTVSGDDYNLIQHFYVYNND